MMDEPAGTRCLFSFRPLLQINTTTTATRNRVSCFKSVKCRRRVSLSERKICIIFFKNEMIHRANNIIIISKRNGREDKDFFSIEMTIRLTIFVRGACFFVLLACLKILHIHHSNWSITGQIISDGHRPYLDDQTVHRPLSAAANNNVNMP